MEGVSRWLCSFFADEVTVHQHERTITCGEKVLLCSLSLTNPKSTFTNYHEDKIAVLYCNGNRETRRHKDCKWSIEVNPELINVYFTAYRAGNVSVKLDLENGTYSRVRKTNKYKNKYNNGHFTKIFGQMVSATAEILFARVPIHGQKSEAVENRMQQCCWGNIVQCCQQQCSALLHLIAG